MKRVFTIFLLLVIAGLSAQAQGFQDFMNQSKVSGSFQFDGAYYLPDEKLGFTEEDDIRGQPFRFNGFGNITYSIGNFTAGVRYEAYLPPLLGFEADLEGQGISNYYAMYTHEKFSLTVGTFYEQFGNGLTLRTYEQWMLGYDNSLNGARVIIEPVKGLIIKGVYGTQRYFWEKYERNGRGIVKGGDAELDFNQVLRNMDASKFRLSIGGSAVSKYQNPVNQKNLVYPANVSNLAGRFNLGIGKFDWIAEYAWKVNDPSKINNYIYKDGEALMTSLTYSTKGFGVFAMFKRYDNMSYRSDRDVTQSALDINFLPPNTETHTYMLTAMYPYATQPNGEIGYQFQVNYKIPKKSKLGGKYGIGIMVNYSQVNDIHREAVQFVDEYGEPDVGIGEEASKGWTSPFFKFGETVFWQDLNIEIDKKFSRKLKGTFQYMYQTYNIDILEGHPEDGPMVYANMAVLDMTYKFTSKHALRWEVQGLWTQQDDGDWAAILLEYTVSPHWFVAVLDQWNYRNPHAEEESHYPQISLGYTHRTTRLSVSYGRQREGIVCVGGVCRAVPASNGFGITISSNF